MTTRKRARMKGLYLNLPSHATHVRRLAAADPDFWGASPEVAAAAAAAEKARRDAKASLWMQWRADHADVPEITFPQGEATDMRQGQAYRYCEVNGVGEWFAVGSARASQLARWYQAWAQAHREIWSC